MTNATATDTHLPTKAPQTDGLSRDEVRGRSAGIIVGAVMGLTWVGSALLTLSSLVAVPVLVASVAVVAVQVTGARRLRRGAMTMPASTPARASLRKARRSFTLVTAGEGAAIAAAGSILARSGHSLWIPAVICAVVGLHFVALARLFSLQLYYATAMALCLVAVITMILGATGSPASLWQLVPGFGAALALWATSARLLVATPIGSST